MLRSERHPILAAAVSTEPRSVPRGGVRLDESASITLRSSYLQRNDLCVSINEAKGAGSAVLLPRLLLPLRGVLFGDAGRNLNF